MKLRIIFMYVSQFVMIQFFYCGCCLTECFNGILSFICCSSCDMDNVPVTTAKDNIEIEEDENIKVTNGYISIKKREEGNSYNIYLSKKEESLRISFMNSKCELQENVFTNWGFKYSDPVVIKNGVLCTTIKKTLFKRKKDGEYTFCLKSVDDVEIEDIVVVFYVGTIDNKAIRFRIQKNKITPIKIDVVKEEDNKEEEKKEDNSVEDNKEDNSVEAKKEKKEEKKEEEKKEDIYVSSTINDPMMKDLQNISSIGLNKNHELHDTNLLSSTNSIDSTNFYIKSIHSTDNSYIDKIFKELKDNILYSNSKISFIKKDSKYKILKDKLRIWFESVNGEELCMKVETAIFKNRGRQIISGMYTSNIKKGFLENDYDFSFTKIKDKTGTIKEIKVKITCEGTDEAIYVVDNDGKDVIQV